MSPRQLLRTLGAKTHRLRHEAHRAYIAIADWADTPQGRLTRWALGIVIVLLLAGRTSK